MNCFTSVSNVDRSTRWRSRLRHCATSRKVADSISPIPVTARSKAWTCGRSLAGIAASNPAGGIDVCVLRCEDKGTSQGNQGKEIYMEKVQRQNKRRTSEKNVPMGSLRFLA